MKVLILSCNTGGGHNACAKAICDSFAEKGISCTSVDALAFISGRTSSVMSNGHTWIYRHCPRLFSKGYAHADKKRSSFSEGSAAYKFFAKSTPELYRFIVRGGYDVVICAHVFTALMLTDVLKKHKLSILSAFFATDYTFSPSGDQSNLDLYFIPDTALVSEFEGYGIDVKKIRVSGIPTRSEFATRRKMADAKKVIGIHENHAHIVVMSGSMGCGPIKKLTKFLSASLSHEQEVSVVCGTNKSLFAELSDMYENDPRIHIKGYVKDISLLLDSADLYLTKPGGISVTEAAVKGLPMVLLNAVAGCEEYNMNFLLERGCAVTGADIREITDTAVSLLSDKEKLAQMSRALKALNYAGAADNIRDDIIKCKGEIDSNERIHTV